MNAPLKGLVTRVKNRSHHIGIVPVAGPRQRHQHVLVVAEVINDVEDRVPRVLDVVVVAPQVACADDAIPVNLTLRKYIYC